MVTVRVLPQQWLERERKARHALLGFRATSMIDVAAKAAYVRTLLRDGATGLDEKDWETLLQSFSDHDGY